MKIYIKILICVLTSVFLCMQANAQGFGNLRGLIPGSSKDQPPESTGFPSLNDLIPDSETEESPLSKIFAGGAGCTLGGAAGYFGIGELNERFGNKGKQLSDEELDQLKLGAALAGCVVGATAGLKIIENMSESAKQAQEAAWQQAQLNTGQPIEWQDPEDPTTRGSTELTEIETMPSGEKCGFRRDIIESVEGEAKPLSRVCESNDGWQVQV